MAGQITNNLGNLAAAQYLAGYRPGQQAPQPQNADPNDALAQALALNYQGPQNHGPVYSVAGGLANAAGDIGEAYAQRKRTEAILGYEQAAAGAEEKAEETAANTQAAMDYGTGTSMNVAGGAPTDPNATATLNTPSTGQQMPGVPGEGGPITTGQVSMPANMTAAQMLTPQQRGMAAQHQLAQASPLLAQQMAGRLQQTAQGAQPPPMQTEKYATASGNDIGIVKDPITGLPTGQRINPTAPSGNPNDIAAANLSAKPTTASENADQLGLTGDAREKYIKSITTEGLPERWRQATAQEKSANNIPLNTPAQISDKTGEIKPLPAQPGEIGPAYDSNTGSPLGVVKYTDPDTAAKLQSGAILPHEPKPLEGTAAESLLKLGNQTAELQSQMSRYDPSYQRIIDSDSKMRGFVGGAAFNNASEWMNNTKSILLQNTKDVAGRSPQLIEEYNAIRPESTDSADTIVRKMQNLIALKRFETAQQAGSLLQGGYLGNQVVSAAGFDPRKNPAPLPQTEEQVGAAAAGTLTPQAAATPTPKPIGTYKGRPVYMINGKRVMDAGGQ